MGQKSVQKQEYTMFEWEKGQMKNLEIIQAIRGQLIDT